MNILPKILQRVSSFLAESIADEVVREDTPSAKQIFRALWKLFKRKKLLVIAFIAIIVVGVIVYERYFNLTEAERAQKELAAAMASVSKHMILPESDEPVLATVTDAEALIKQQAFFAGAVNGDQLLLFPRNLKAILYSSSRNRIINAGPIEQQQIAAENPQPQASSADRVNTPSPVATTAERENLLTIEIRNGTGKNGLGAYVANTVQTLDGFEVLKVGDAESKKYKKTVIISHAENGLDKTKIQTLASAIGAEVQENLPVGESPSSADVLIIVGEGKE